ncbi:hypothetical protein PAERUG_P6_East_of_England_6_IMP_1_03_09_01068 [Pseudomonas aeruginosa]|nr:hypothetical protein PAERUG_P6_East_of_England_6_IMP_1_03_09_01068 [Pseudomonas aeruginosa]
MIAPAAGARRVSSASAEATARSVSSAWTSAWAGSGRSPASSSSASRSRNRSTCRCRPSSPDCASSSRLSGHGAPCCCASVRCCSRSWARLPSSVCPARRAPPLRVCRIRSRSSSGWASPLPPSQRPSASSRFSSRSSASSRKMSRISLSSAAAPFAASGLRLTLVGTLSCSSGSLRRRLISAISACPSGSVRWPRTASSISASSSWQRCSRPNKAGLARRRPPQRPS